MGKRVGAGAYPQITQIEFIEPRNLWIANFNLGRHNENALPDPAHITRRDADLDH
jgi:hypothetical protein